MASVERLPRQSGVGTREGKSRRCDAKQTVKGEDLLMQKPARFMANSDHIGREATLKRQGRRRRAELTGGGSTKRSEVYPDRLCRAMPRG